MLTRFLRLSYSNNVNRFENFIKRPGSDQAIMSQCPEIPTVNYEEVKNVKNDNTVLLIDVREPSELETTGIIPGSINLPLGSVQEVLKNMSAEEFKKVYNRAKPDSDCEVIFSCRSGKRSCDAARIASGLGYRNIKNYAGGWLDWETHL